jgi:hypothetical protein
MSPFPRQLAWFTACIFSAALAAALMLLAHEGRPPLLDVVLFGTLIIATSHLPVLLRRGVAVSPGLLVCMAAVAVFVDRRSLLGAGIVCAAAFLRVADMRRDRWGWLPFNTGLSFLSYVAAGAVLMLFHVSDIRSTPLAALAVVPAALAYIAVAWGIIVLSYLFEGTRRPREVFVELLPAGLETLPFAILGFLLGRLYLTLGAGVLVLIFVPILIAREVFRSYTTVAEAHDETVQMLIRALESKDHYTAGHAERVAVYAQYIGEEMHFSPSRMERLRFAALMHDIGKLVVPNQILNKPGRLTEEEFARMRVHEKVAVQMLSHIDFLRPVAHSGHSEQMRFDKDDPNHPIEPYIVMVCDAYDAMTSTRSYRKALAQDVAFQELRDKVGIQFHPHCVDALIQAIERRGEKHGAGYEQQVEFEHAPEAGVGSAGLGDLIEADESLA